MTNVTESISAQAYLRERFDPKPGDFHYLVLSDLLLALRGFIPGRVARVLDYGSGGSPYKSLFGDCVYHRADLDGHELEYKFGPDARLPGAAGNYDFVLSTQVLEHVDDPTSYLSECRRVLAPNGHLLLTTHGSFEDHGCPYDFWRWTPFGLKRIVEAAGLKVKAISKFTTGPRAALFFAERELWRLHELSSGIYGKMLAAGVRTVRRIGPHRLHVTADASFQKYRVVDANVPGHDIYIGLVILATRV